MHLAHGHFVATLDGTLGERHPTQSAGAHRCLGTVQLFGRPNQDQQLARGDPLGDARRGPGSHKCYFRILIVEQAHLRLWPLKDRNRALPSFFQSIHIAHLRRQQHICPGGVFGVMCGN